MKIRGISLLLVVALAGCDGSGLSVVPDSSSPGAPTEPSRSVIFGIYCEDFSQVGTALNSVSKGKQPPHDLNLALGASQRTVDAHLRGADPETREALSEAADALGGLNLAIANAGADYPFDPVVDTRLLSAEAALVIAVRAYCAHVPSPTKRAFRND